ncbi:biotin transporter BioY [Rhodospira trueperi]|uniref:Biotin transporter n=1 Tax=Rhodospira trueperi TaxID=69960 RepID=A0A1G7CTW1_9PROT|nr:biotin transporter BioY [Rhodospira trueperi]SDE42729.1 biotin transport system substrate-specific component [Rhodospira trueperi]
MTTATLTHDTLAQALWPTRANASPVSPALRALLLVLAGSALLTVSAKVQVPMWPVPMTMQTFVVLVIGAAYGWRLGAATVLLYLAEGAFGLPVFANSPERGMGLAYMMGPTGGYLAGFVVSAVALGWLAERGWDRSVVGTLGAMTLGSAIILGGGFLYLSTLIGPEAAWTAGVLPFLLGAALKVALAAAVLPMAWRLVNRRGA